jgi:protein TonB
VAESTALRQRDPDAHLARLLIETGQPWYVSLRNNLAWLFSPKEPPLKVTSRPIPQKEIWGDYRYGRISAPLSLALHGALLALLVASTPLLMQQSRRVYRDVFPMTVSLVVPPLPPAAAKPSGGGGDRSPEPASFGRAPRFAAEQFTPPTVIIRNQNPKLPMDPTLIGPPDLQLPQPQVPQFGDPTGVVGGPPSSGPGSGGGIGSGSGGGVGPGRGPGLGPGEGGGVGGNVYMPGGAVTGPQVIYQVEPEYSEEARKAKHQGLVVLQGVVEPDGRMDNLTVITSLGMGLDDQAMRAVRLWRFKPGTKNGKAVPVWARIEVLFRLL